MTMLTLKAPDPIVGEKLESEIESAGFTDVRVTLVGDNIEVRGGTTVGREIDERDADAVQAVVDRHDGQVDPAVIEAVVAEDVALTARAELKRRFGKAAAHGTPFNAQERDEILSLMVQILGR